MDERLDKVLTFLSDGKSKDSDEVRALVEAIGDPAIKQFAEDMLASWPQRSSATTLGLGGLGVAGGAGIIALVPGVSQWASVNVPLFEVRNSFALLFIVGLVGGLAGLAYSVYVNRAIMLPQFSKQKGKLVLSEFGMLDEVGFGVIAAVTTIWMATVGLNPDPGKDVKKGGEVAGQSANPAVPESLAANTESKNLLSWSVLLGSAASGWFGARMRRGWMGQGLLQGALAEVSVQPAQQSETKNRIRLARSAEEAAHLATGQEVVGANPRVFSEVTRATEGLWRLIEQERVKSSLAEKGLILRKTGEGLKLGMLRGFRFPDPLSENMLSELSLIDVANMTQQQFLSIALESNIDTVKYQRVLLGLQSIAQKVAGTLAAFPDSWTFPKAVDRDRSVAELTNSKGSLP